MSKPKGTENKAYMRAMQELRKSSASSPIPSGKQYKRKPKHSESYSDS